MMLHRMNAVFLLIIYVVTLANWVHSEDIEALDSEFVFLDIRETTLPLPTGARQGVFAKVDIPENEILCEYRGAVIPSSLEYDSDYIFGAVDSQGNSINIVPQFSELVPFMPICSYINDCVEVLGKTFTEEEILALENHTTKLPNYPGAEHNTRPLTTRMGKVFVVASKRIPAGSELFFEYGGTYWTHRLRRPAEFGLTVP